MRMIIVRIVMHIESKDWDTKKLKWVAPEDATCEGSASEHTAPWTDFPIPTVIWISVEMMTYSGSTPTITLRVPMMVLRIPTWARVNWTRAWISTSTNIGSSHMGSLAWVLATRPIRIRPYSWMHPQLVRIATGCISFPFFWKKFFLKSSTCLQWSKPRYVLMNASHVTCLLFSFPWTRSNAHIATHIPFATNI